MPNVGMKDLLHAAREQYSGSTLESFVGGDEDLKLESPWPAHYFLGALSLEFGVNIICTCHFLACVAFITTCSSVAPIRFIGVEIPAWAQVANAAWQCIGILFICAALVGNAHSIVGHVMWYFRYLFATVVLQVAPILIFLISGSFCTTSLIMGPQHNGSGYACGMADNFIFAWMMAIAACSLYAVYIVWSRKEWIILRQATESGDLLHKHHEASKAGKQKTGRVMHPLVGQPVGQMPAGGLGQGYGMGGGMPAVAKGVRSAGAVAAASAARGGSVLAPPALEESNRQTYFKNTLGGGGGGYDYESYGGIDESAYGGLPRTSGGGFFANVMGALARMPKGNYTQSHGWGGGEGGE